MPATAAKQAGRVTRAAPGYKKSTGTKKKRKPLLDAQRVEYSKRTTNAKREVGKQATAAVRAYQTKEVLREAGRIRRQTIDKQTGAYRQRNFDRNVAAIERRKAYNREQTKQSYKNTIIHQPIQRAAAPIASTGIVLIGVFFGLIIFYMIITNAQGFTGWLSGVSNAMQLITHTGALFTKKSTTGS